MKTGNSDLNRREFIKGGSFASLMMLMGGVPVLAADKETSTQGLTHYKAEYPPLKLGIIGCGVWAREILKTLSTMPYGPVVAVCETYPAYLRRAGRLAPKAKKYVHYHDLLADANVEGVIVSTPSHLHKQIAVDALKAGKHVYCEAPMATTVEDAHAIAAAAKANPKLNFQVGLQNRSDLQITNLNKLIRTNVLGTPMRVRQQYHRKQSWRFTSPNPQREKEINWRLDKKVSIGLVGEIGVHQIDVANWYLMGLPEAVTGFGSLLVWNDGRTVPDTVSAMLHYPHGVLLAYDATIGNSFNGEMGVFLGSDSAVMMRNRRAWMFKEFDAPQLGWEVYAKKDIGTFSQESGIVLGAGSTVQADRSKVGAGAAVDPISALKYSLTAFTTNSYRLQGDVKNYNASYDASDLDGLRQYLKGLEKSRLDAADWQDGLHSAVTVIKAHEAVMQGGRIEFKKEWFQLA